LSGPKVWFWEYGSSPWSFFGDLVSEKAVGKMGGAGTFLLVDPAYDLVIAYLTNYGQPEKTLAGDALWNKFQTEINMMALCNLVIGNLPV
jgi:CubicO group peptidase (beta-lactamase class C family)